MIQDHLEIPEEDRFWDGSIKKIEEYIQMVMKY
jgi:hypothetical protein